MAATVRTRFPLLALVLVGVLTYGAAWLSGSGRRQTTPIEPVRIANFASLPDSVGLWRHELDAEIEQPVINMVQSAAYSARVYRHDVTGRKLTVVALLGPSGPIAAHTPQVCYAATGYQLLSEHVQTVQVGSDPATTRLHAFQCSRWGLRDLPDRLSVFHAWNAGELWESPAYPRVSYAGKSWLYSLQIVVPNDAGADAPAEDAEICSQFLAEYLPAAAHVFTASPAPPPDKSSPLPTLSTP